MLEYWNLHLSCTRLFNIVVVTTSVITKCIYCKPVRFKTSCDCSEADRMCHKDLCICYTEHKETELNRSLLAAMNIAFLCMQAFYFGLLSD